MAQSEIAQAVAVPRRHHARNILQTNPLRVFQRVGAQKAFSACEDVGGLDKLHRSSLMQLLLLNGLPAVVAKRMGGSCTRVGEPVIPDIRQTRRSPTHNRHDWGRGS